MTIIDTLTNITPEQVNSGLNALKILVRDTESAWESRGKDVDKDLLIAQDIANMLTGVPVVGGYAHDAAIGIAILRFVIVNADKNYIARPIVPEGNGGISI